MTSTEPPPQVSSGGEAPEAIPSIARSYARRRKRPSRFRRVITGLWTQWRAEIAIALMLGLGLFLVADPHIRRTVLGWAQGLGRAVGHLGGDLFRGLGSLVQRSSLADLLGFALVGLGLILVAWRVRKRLATSPRLATRACPRCGGGLHRVHRHALDRILNLYVPVRRYRCRNDACGWEGLRTGRRHEG